MGYTTKMLCLQALVVLCILSSVNGQCAEFEFTGISNSKAYTATEGVHFKLPFSLNMERCQGVQTDYIITVSKSNTVNDVCKMLINSTGRCVSFRPEECVCEKEEGHYSVSKIADRSDATSWTLKVNNKSIAAEYNIHINVKDSPSTKDPTISVQASHTTLGQLTTGTQGTEEQDTSNSTLQTDPSTEDDKAISALIIGIVIAVVVLIVIIAIVATVLAVRRRRGLPLFRRASGQRNPINFRRPDSKMPADNQEGYLYPTSLNQKAPEEVLDMTPRPPPRTAINPEYEFQPQSGTLQRFEM